MNLAITIVVRNNNPHLDSTEFDAKWRSLREEYDSIDFMLFNDGYNVGFGVGHNLNFGVAPGDYFLILNDDIGFPHLGWLDQAIAILNNNSKMAAVGAVENPTSITPFFANGVNDRAGIRWPLRYAEGSVLLVKAQAFQDVGQFDKAYGWAMFEDADLSFRLQAHGYEIAWIDIPHQHWRSSSFNVLPGQVKLSILEHNRSVMFSKWNTALRENRIGRVEIYDLWSDGIGDVFCALLHLRVFMDDLTESQKRNVVINTSALELARILFGDMVSIASISDPQELRARFAVNGVRSFRTTRGVNYGLPFNIHALVCAALGIPVASRAALTALLHELPVSREVGDRPEMPEPPYCVLHLESTRTTHDGRGPSPMVAQAIAEGAASQFQHLVLVGNTRLVNEEDLKGFGARITDLQGQLSLKQLIELVTGADAFVGIDSFPAHIAQAAGVRSALFFGSVHPSFRVLSEGLTWPIVRPLDCIGCYHILLEPSAPFCMRRDLLCTREIDADLLNSTITACASLDVYDWSVLTAQALELQRKFFMKMLFHPAPERRFFDVHGTSNHTATNLIYQVIEQVREAMTYESGDTFRNKLTHDLEKARSEIFQKDVRIESMVKLISELRRQH